MKFYLLVIKPMTDVSGIKLVERKCACGCRQTFRVMPTSTQKYRSDDCVRLKGMLSKRNEKWRQGMNFMVKG